MSVNNEILSQIEVIKRTMRETVNLLAQVQLHIEKYSLYVKRIESMTCKDQKYKSIYYLMNRLALDFTVSSITIRRVFI